MFNFPHDSNWFWWENCRFLFPCILFRKRGGIASCIARTLLDLHWRTDVVIGCLIHCIHPSVRPSVRPSIQPGYASFMAAQITRIQMTVVQECTGNTMTEQDGISLLVWQANSLAPRSLRRCQDGQFRALKARSLLAYLLFIIIMGDSRVKWANEQ